MTEPDPLSWAPPARAYHGECRTCEVVVSGIASGRGRKVEIAAAVGIWGRRHSGHDQQIMDWEVLGERPEPSA